MLGSHDFDAPELLKLLQKGSMVTMTQILHGSERPWEPA